MPTEPDIPDFLDRRPKTKAKSWRDVPPSIPPPTCFR